ncbi:unnamed protein product [Symbiodinium pilosum]|uniref:Uncharacterized protein n=1 Tax=Symbiodinium pilosum TaxID=2952 RepID=A0A812LCU2_SYMPI|nr:unnamed protein product [Symbiodinium pilosum]
MSWVRGKSGNGPTTLLTSSRSVPAELCIEDDACSSPEGGFVRALSAVALDTMAPVQIEALPGRAKRWAAKRRFWTGLAVAFAVLLGLERRLERFPEVDTPEVAEEEQRPYLKEGSVYQNDYMTLWNANEVAISATLRMQDLQHFELRITNLDSKGGGNDGWFAVRGSFQLQPAAAGKFKILPQKSSSGKSDMVFSFDESLHDGAALFLYRCLRRLGGPGILNFLQLEVDSEKDTVFVAPTARILRALWDQPVVLRLTSEDKLWMAKKPPRAS